MSETEATQSERPPDYLRSLVVAIANVGNPAEPTFGGEFVTGRWCVSSLGFAADICRPTTPDDASAVAYVCSSLWT